jgi:transcriptional regulator with XRE-family HTH domain
MDKELVAKYLKQLKEKTGLTYGDIAEKSKRSESSLKYLFFGNVDDPRVDTIMPIVYALGGSMDEMLNPGKSRDELKEVSVVQLREMYESQIATMKETSEAHINNIRAHYEQHHEDLKENYEMRLSDKRELIKTLERECLSSKIFSWICVLVLVVILVAELMNPTLGWIKF